MNPQAENHSPFFSVIVCAYNEEKLLGQCLESIFTQSYPPDKFELLIIDDESTDQTPEIVADWISRRQSLYPHINYIRIKHGGLAIARNTGIKFSRGEVLVFIDGDAVAVPDWLKNFEKPFKSENADFSGGRIELLNSDSPIARMAQLIRHKQFFGPDIFLNHFIGCNMAIRRKIFQHVGGFIENFSSRGDEVSLHFRIKDKFVYQPAPEAIVYHERPDKLMDWVKTEWKSATLWGLTKRLLPIEQGWRPLARKLEMAFLIALPIAIFISPWNPLGIVILFFSSIAFYRHLFVYPVNRRIFNDLANALGKFKGALFYSLYIYWMTTNSFLGNSLGIWKYRKVSLNPPGTSNPEIVNVKSSHQ